MLLLLAMLLGAAGRAQSVAPGGFDGRLITRIDFDPPEQPLPREELDRLLPLRVGSALLPDDVRAALQRLYETGRYANVSIGADSSGDGVALRIATEMNYFVGSVTLDGAADPPNRGQLLTAS